MQKKTEISDYELNQIKQRCDKATSGPWISYIEGRDHTSGSNFIMTGNENNRGEDIELIGGTIYDQDFIAHARQDIPNLINEIKRLKKSIKNE
ncbi:hypothetical protein J3U75_09150 [Snodgrassella sp. B3088]|uniref:hypothetical protein n=1 Tax=unclassified Snodgrassella TaxID=2625236 RepID=UPI00226981FF|nr:MULTISPECIES: hypothetical protein [unclassified Snodgrassella]MCX8749538.1 hypothetical protein [Snodgrassella sp. B3088]MCX8753106.1 hypothetical protein [Snodgrassella sp. B3837]